MDLTTLEIFRLVALENSITRAAQRLQRVQSNVTTRIQQLEEELGVALFLRDGKRMSLTEQGRAFLDYAERLLSLADEARQAMHPDRPGGRLRLGSMESTAATRLPRPLAAFHGECPEVTLEVSTGTSAALIDGVLARRLDCALVALPENLDATALPGHGLQGDAVFREELLLALPPGHPVVESPAQVRVQTLAGFAKGCTYRQIGEQWLTAEGTPPGFRVQEVGSYHAILACVAAGTCIGVLPRSVLDLQRDPAPVVTHSLREIDTWLVWRDGYATAAFQRFRGLFGQNGA